MSSKTDTMFKHLIGTLCCLCMLTLPVSAAPQWCVGVLNGVYQKNDGSVLILGSWRSDWIQICHPDVDWKGVPAATCQRWFSMIQAAVLSQANVTVYYDDAPACADLPFYELAPGAGYLMIRP